MSFFFPKLSWMYALRVTLVALSALFFFGMVCRPCVINVASMLPTYPSMGVNFCWCPAFWFREPRRGEVVIIRYVGERTLLLKRLVAKEGDVVAFVHGTLLVNGQELNGDWSIQGPCDWELEPRMVEKGCAYVVGDNRSMDMDAHIFGQVPVNRIIGAPLW